MIATATSVDSTLPYPAPTGIEASDEVITLFRQYGPAYRWLATITVTLASFMALLAVTIVNVAIPDIMSTFGMDQTEAQWLSSSYLAATTVTMLLTVWAASTMGIRNTMVLAIGFFVLGAFLSGTAQSKEALGLARLIQGSAAGLIPPLSMVIVFQVFPTNRRATAMGIFGIGQMLGPALGPSLGGLLIDFFNWRYIFFAMIPIALISLPLCMLFLPGKVKDSPKISLDLVGIVLLTLSLAAFISAFSNSQLLGWDSTYVVLSGATSMISVIAFISWESITEHPMLDLSLFSNGQFATTAFLSFIMGLGLYGSTFLFPLFLQTLQGMRAADSGNLLIIPGLVMAFVFPIAGRIGDSIQPRILIILGLGLFAWSTALFGTLDLNTPFLAMGLWLVLGRIGLGCIFPCLNAAALSSLPFNKLNHASGTINFARQLGGALGVNMMSIYFAQQQSSYYVELQISQTANANTLDMLAQVKLLLPQLSTTEQHYVSLYRLVEMLQSQAATLAFRDSFLAISVIFILTMIPSWNIRVARQA